jgi:hypothetical protein
VELIGQARRDLAYGAQRTQLWLRRVHDVRVAAGTLQRVFRDLGLPRLRRTRKRVPRQMKLVEKAEPGESVQVDVKFVKIAGRWAFQYTALDDCTRFRVLRLSGTDASRKAGDPAASPSGVALVSKLRQRTADRGQS